MIDLDALEAVAREATAGEWVLVPREPGTCEGDDSGWVLAFLNALHAHLPEDERPTSWMQFSDGQRDRIKDAYRAMISAAPQNPVSGMREEVARIVDRRWWDLRDIYLARGVSEYSAAAIADSSYAPDRRNALAKADAILAQRR